MHHDAENRPQAPYPAVSGQNAPDITPLKNKTKCPLVEDKMPLKQKSL